MCDEARLQEIEGQLAALRFVLALNLDDLTRDVLKYFLAHDAHKFPLKLAQIVDLHATGNRDATVSAIHEALALSDALRDLRLDNLR